MSPPGNIHRDSNELQSGDAEAFDKMIQADVGKRGKAPAERIVIALLLIICCFALASNLLR